LSGKKGEIIMEIKKVTETKGGLSVLINNLRTKVLLDHLHYQRVMGHGIAIEYKPIAVTDMK